MRTCAHFTPPKENDHEIILTPTHFSVQLNFYLDLKLIVEASYVKLWLRLTFPWKTGKTLFSSRNAAVHVLLPLRSSSQQCFTLPLFFRRLICGPRCDSVSTETHVDVARGRKPVGIRERRAGRQTKQTANSTGGRNSCKHPLGESQKDGDKIPFH